MGEERGEGEYLSQMAHLFFGLYIFLLSSIFYLQSLISSSICVIITSFFTVFNTKKTPLSSDDCGVNQYKPSYGGPINPTGAFNPKSKSKICMFNCLIITLFIAEIMLSVKNKIVEFLECNNSCCCDFCSRRLSPTLKPTCVKTSVGIASEDRLACV